MGIAINNDLKIFVIQKEFSDLFPFLKLEFYSKYNKDTVSPSAKLMKHISKTIAECRTINSSGFITIQPQMTVEELVQGFRDIYGLYIEVFRKSANNWLGVSDTSGTLEKQNIAGMESNIVERIL